MNASCFGFSTAFELSDHYNKPGDRLLQRLKGRESLESWCSKAFPFGFISGDFSAEHSFANLGIVGAEGEHFICLKGALRFLKEFWAFEPARFHQLVGGDSASGQVCGVLLTLHVSPLLGGRQTPDLLYSVGHVNVESAAFIRDVAEYYL